MTEKIEIPQGYRLDMHGRLVPENKIKPIDLERDTLVNSLMALAKQHQQVLRQFKLRTFEDIMAFVQLSAEQYDVKIGGDKGNITLYSFDGRYKIIRQNQDSIRFDEKLQVAKSLIDECIHDWAEGSNENIQALINDAFQVDKEGKISIQRVLGLRRLNIHDEKWQRAMQAISDSITIVGSKDYIRFYERDEHDKYQAVSLDFANI